MATNLYQYYTGKGQTLPDQATRSSLYSQYGLGGGYTGTAQQNTALLNKLQTPGGNPTGTAPNTTQGGYASTPTGAPQPINNDPGVNDLTTFASNNAADRQALLDRLSAESNGAYDKYASDTGLTTASDLLKRITGDMAGTSVQIADTPLNVNKEVQGSFANDGQRQGEINTDLVPLNALYSKIATALPGASQAYSAAQQAVQNKLAVLHDNQARQVSGFDTNAQQQLAAIQAKVARGQALTDEEFKRETDLSIAKMQYNATIQAAQASAGGQIGAANVNAAASKANTAASIEAALKGNAYQYPGINVTPGANGTYVGSTPFSGPPASSASITPASISDFMNKNKNPYSK